MSVNFKNYSQYYNLLYQDKDYNAEAKYIINLLNHYSPSCKSILELGSGTGIHAQLFANAGFVVYGIERSSDMVAIANKKLNEKVKFEVGDITDFSLNQKFDVALSLFHVVSYITNSSQLIKTFKNVAQSLNAKGIFIFDVWHSAAVNYQVPEKRTKKLENDDIEIVRKATPTLFTEFNIVEVDYDIIVKNKLNQTEFSFQENHPMRHFSKPEIELLAFATGFEVLASEEFLSKNTPSINTWGVCYMLRKIN